MESDVREGSVKTRGGVRGRVMSKKGWCHGGWCQRTKGNKGFVLKKCIVEVWIVKIIPDVFKKLIQNITVLNELSCKFILAIKGFGSKKWTLEILVVQCLCQNPKNLSKIVWSLMNSYTSSSWQSNGTVRRSVLLTFGLCNVYARRPQITQPKPYAPYNFPGKFSLAVKRFGLKKCTLDILAAKHLCQMSSKNSSKTICSLMNSYASLSWQLKGLV